MGDRAEFEKACGPFRYDYTKTKDSWGQDKYSAPHIESMYLGFKVGREASRTAPTQAGYAESKRVFAQANQDFVAASIKKGGGIPTKEEVENQRLQSALAVATSALSDAHAEMCGAHNIIKGPNMSVGINRAAEALVKLSAFTGEEQPK